MQKKDIKVGGEYAWSTSTGHYGTPDRVCIVDLAAEFTMQRRLGWAGKTEQTTEVGIKALMLDENGEIDGTYEPIRVRNPRHIWSTWADYEVTQQDRRARAAADAQAREKSQHEQEALRRDLLLLLAVDADYERERIKRAPVRGRDERSAYLDLGEITGERLLALLEAAYKRGREWEAQRG